MKGIITLLIFFSTIYCATGQSFWKPLPKPAYSSVVSSPPTIRAHALSLGSIIDSTTTPLPDSTFEGFRPQGPSVLYGFPGNTVMAGIGIGWEHDTYTQSTNSWYTDWAIGPMVYAGGQVAPTTLAAVAAIGVQASFFNRRLTFGGAYNIAGGGFIALVGTSFTIFNVN